MDFVLSETIGKVRRITLNRPEKLNAWNQLMRAMLIECLDAAEADPTIRAIVLTGAGTRAFGSGQDFTESMEFDAARAHSWGDEWRTLYGKIRSSSKPIVAALNGLAAGSAFQAALLCDMRVAHPGVRMGQPEINSGIPSVTGEWIIREMLGMGRAIDLILTGRLLESKEAYEFGLISRLVAEDEVQSAALALAAELGEKPPVAMRLCRQRIAERSQAAFDDAMGAGRRIQSEAYAAGEPQMMMKKFLEVRAARKQ